MYCANSNPHIPFPELFIPKNVSVMLVLDRMIPKKHPLFTS